MKHLSFFWLPNNKEKLLKAIESEFAQLVEQSIAIGKISLPPIPEVVLKIQQLCQEESTTIADVANCLLEDPGLAAVVVRVANSVIFNRRNITCNDLTAAVSRLGIYRVRDIVTAQTIEQLKHSLNLTKDCNEIMRKSAAVSRELGASMVLIVQEFHRHDSVTYGHLEQEKALLVGLLADIGLFCLINEYNMHLEGGNYLAPDIALQIFQARCSATSERVLERWGFDNDYREVSSNQKYQVARPEVSYLDIARIANYLLMFRNKDERIDEHEVEFNLTGAEILYELSNMSEAEFQEKMSTVLTASGM